MLSILKGLLGLANIIAGYLSDKQLLDAGKDQATVEYLQKAINNVSKAKMAVNRYKSNTSIAKRLRNKYNIK